MLFGELLQPSGHSSIPKAVLLDRQPAQELVYQCGTGTSVWRSGVNLSKWPISQYLILTGGRTTWRQRGSRHNWRAQRHHRGKHWQLPLCWNRAVQAHWQWSTGMKKIMHERLFVFVANIDMIKCLQVCVDGQQRLTTNSLLLAALRDAALGIKTDDQITTQRKDKRVQNRT